jgi:hypothetical protein
VKKDGEGAGMKIKKIREIAKKNSIDPAAISAMSKTDLIRAIQRAEGYSECFATKNINQCEHLDCLWRGDCVTTLSL